MNETNVNSPEREDRRTLNREMYNIITYFVTKSEISSIVRALCLKPDDFVQLTRRIAAEARSEGSLSHYYVVGSVSSGKSSLIERLRGFRTFEEWPETPLELMFKDPKSLTPEETKQVDAWVLKQLAKKNEMMRSARYGIFIMDRAPLDMFAFSKTADENVDKAQRLGIAVGKDGLQAGGVIQLSANADVLFERQVRRGRGPEWLKEDAYDGEDLVAQGRKISVIYGITHPLDTSRLSADNVARTAAERILFAEYDPVDPEKRRADYEAGETL